MVGTEKKETRDAEQVEVAPEETGQQLSQRLRRKGMEQS